MGSTAFVIAMSERPEYNDKVSAAFLMGPAAFMSRSETPFTPVIQFSDDFFHTLESVGFKEILPYGEMYYFFSAQFCSPDSLTLEVCAHVFSMLTGVDESRIDKSLLSLYVDHFPAGSNTRTIAHYAQLSQNDGRFCKYDYGTAEKNMEAYGQEMPPDYEISKVNNLSLNLNLSF